MRALFGGMNELNAQNYFTKVIYDTIHITEARAAIQTYDGNFVLVGFYDNVSQVIKMDNQGTFLWGKSFENTGMQNDFNCVTETADNCIVAAGNIYNQTGGYFDLLCVKLNSNGDTLWTKTNKLGKYGDAISVCGTRDSGAIVTAYFSNADYSLYTMSILKYGAIGNLQWSKNYTSGDWYNFGFSIKEQADSGYYVSGFSQSHPSTLSPPPPPSFENNAFLLKLSSTGAVLDATRFALQYPDLHLKGMDFSFSNNEMMLFMRGGDNNNAYVLKLDSSMNLMWAKKYDAILYSYFNDLTQTFKFHKTAHESYVFSSPDEVIKIDSSGNIICAKQTFMFGRVVQSLETNDNGLFLMSNGPIMGVKNVPSTNPQIGTAKTDSAGWNNTICAFATTMSSAEDTIMVFQTAITATNGPGLDSILPKMHTINLSTISSCVAFTGAVHENDKEKSLIVYPNPSTGIFNLGLNQIKSIVSIEIYNVYGKLINLTQTSESSIDISSQPNGVYFLKLFTDNKQYTQKIVLSR